ncbi:MAG: hypothetical protein COC08_00395 [Maribacter sp.]|nr:MAG: hypothetical protein COC08_00395 [Maribacter sp.]
MNKTLSLILIILGLGLIAYNATLINFENPLEGNSVIALIGIVAALCAIVLLLLFITSKRIQKTLDKD